jgi:hypothetical protein
LTYRPGSQTFLGNENDGNEEFAMDYQQRYTVTVTYELVAADGAKSGDAHSRTATIWAGSAAAAEKKVERWAQREFHRPGFTVTAHATDAQLAPRQ